MARAHDRYPQLFEFLAAWFAEADLEGRSDRAAADAYARTADARARASVLAQGQALLAAKAPPWRQMAEAANRRFPDAKAAEAWLRYVLKSLE